MNLLKITVAAALIFLFTACSVPEVELSASEYMSLGNDYMKENDYKNAIPAFESAVLSASGPEEARSAQLQLANAYFAKAESAWLFKDEEGYLNAIASYEVYYDLYAGDENTRLVLTRLALAYSSISLPARNDQAFTQKAADYFDELESKYPSAFSLKGKVDLRLVRRNMIAKLAEHEFEVAKFYVRTKKPDSAVQRLLHLMRTYPGSAFEADALVILTEVSYASPKMKSAAKEYFDELSARFPDNKEIPRLKKKYNW
jgi:outer membrane protein assembly factor BamD